MDLSALLKRAGQKAAKNSPAILTAIGVTGTLTTAYLAAKAAFNSVDALKKAEEAKSEKYGGEGFEPGDADLNIQDKVEAVWKLYVPAAAVATVTITAIICSNRISDRRTAALASAYSVVNKSYEEYRDKVTGKIGKNKEQAIRDEIAQDEVDRHPLSKTPFIVTDSGGPTLCFDQWSGRYFNSDHESIRQAVNDFNAKVINETYGSLSDFWHLLDIDPTTDSDLIGWSTDKLLEVDYSYTTVNENPCLAVRFKVFPSSRYTELY
jgi:hypothetical protein